MKFEIVQAYINDFEIIVRLLSSLYRELGEEEQSISLLSQEKIEEIISSNITEVFLVKEQTKTIGIFTLTESQAIYAGGKYGVIDELFIDPNYRSQKIGKYIIQFVSGKANGKKWKRIDVTAPTDAKWERTRRFYEQNGFIFTGPKYKLYIQF